MATQAGKYEFEIVADASQADREMAEFKQNAAGMASDNERRQKKMNDYINKEHAESVKKQKAETKKHSKMLKSEHEKRLANVKGNQKKELSETKRYQKQQEQLQRKHSKKMAAIREKESKKSGVAGAKGKAGKASAGAGGGLGGAMAGIGAVAGPAGLAIGAALGGAVKLFSSATEAAKEFESGVARINTLLSDKQALALPDVMGKLQSVSIETGASMESLQGSLYNVISAVPSLANNLDAAAQVSAKASKTALALGADTNEMTGAATNLANALGISMESAEGQNKVFDILANTMKQGVIPSGSVLASNIAKAAPAMNALTTSSEESINTLGAMTASLTANGVSMEESQTQIKALSMELLDSKKAAKLASMGLDGLTKEGKVEDWAALIASAGQDVDKFAAALGSSEAQNALRILGKEGGAAFGGLMESMDTAGGTADAMFQKMVVTSETQGKRLGAAWDSLLVGLGSSTNGVMGSIKGTMADAFVVVSDFFASSQDKMAKQLVQAAEMKSAGEAMAGLSASITASTAEGPATEGDMLAKLEQVRIILPEIATASTGMAAEIQRVMNSEMSLPAQLERVNILMQGAGLLANQMNLAAALQAGAEAATSMNDALDASAGWFDNLAAGAASVVTGPVDLLIGGFNTIAGTNFDGLQESLGLTGDAMRAIAFDEAFANLPQAEADLARLSEELGGLDATSDASAWADKVREVQTASEKVLDLQGQTSGLQENITTLALDTVTAQMAVADASAEGLDKAELINQVFASGVNPAMRESEEFMQQLNDALDDQIGLSQDAAAEAEIQAEIEAMRLDSNEAINGILEDQGLIEAGNTEQKAVALDAIAAQQESLADQMEAQIAMAESSVLTDDAKTIAMQNILNLQNAINAAKGSEIVAQAASLADTNAALEAAKGAAASARDMATSARSQAADIRSAIGTASTSSAGRRGGSRASAGRAARGEADADREAEKAAKEAARAEAKRAKDAEKAATALAKIQADAQKERAEKEKQAHEAAKKALETQRKLALEIAAGLEALSGTLSGTGTAHTDLLKKSVAEWNTDLENQLYGALAPVREHQALMEESQVASVAASLEQRGAVGLVASATEELEDLRESLVLWTAATTQARARSGDLGVDAWEAETVVGSDGIARTVEQRFALFEQKAAEWVAHASAMRDAATDEAAREFMTETDFLQKYLSNAVIAGDEKSWDAHIARVNAATANYEADKLNIAFQSQAPISGFQSQQSAAEEDVTAQTEILGQKITELQSLTAQMRLAKLNEALLPAQEIGAELGAISTLTNSFRDELVKMGNAVVALNNTELDMTSEQRINEMAAYNTGLADLNSGIMALATSGDLEEIIGPIGEGGEAMGEAIGRALDAIPDRMADVKTNVSAVLAEIDTEAAGIVAKLHSGELASNLGEERLTQLAQERVDSAQLLTDREEEIELQRQQLEILRTRYETALELTEVSKTQLKLWNRELETAQRIEKLRADGLALREKLKAWNTEINNAEYEALSIEQKREVLLQRRRDQMEEIKILMAEEVFSAKEAGAAVQTTAQHYDDMIAAMEAADDGGKAKISAAMSSAVEAIGAVDGFLKKLDETFNAIANGADETSAYIELAVDGGQALADVVGKITGLPFGEIFGALESIIRTIVSLVDEVVAEYDEAYQATIRNTAALAQIFTAMDKNNKTRQLTLDFETKITDQYKAQVDTAEEQMAINEKNLDILQQTVDKNFDPIMSGMPTGVSSTAGMDDYETALTKQSDAIDARALAERKLAHATGILESDNIDPAIERNARAMAENAEAQIDALDILIADYDQILDILGSMDELRRQAFKDQVAELDHRKAMGQFDDNELGYLIEKEAIYAELLAQAREDEAEGTIAREDLWAIEEALYNITEERLALENGVTEEIDAQTEAKLRQLRMARQDLIIKAQSGQLSEFERAKMGLLEGEILDLLGESGASPERIAAAQAAFGQASYAKGSAYIEKDQTAMIHKGERILPEYDNHWLTGSVAAVVDRVGFLIDLIKAGQEQSGTTIGTLAINISGENLADPEATASAVYSKFERLHDTAHQKNGTYGGR